MLAYVLAVEAIALVSIPVSGSLDSLARQDWIWFALLLGAALAYQEAARGIERVREVADEGAPYNHLLSVWLFAGVLLLPPSLTALLIGVGYVHAYVRVYRRRALVYRKVFSAATVVIACIGAYLVLSAIYPGHDHPFALVLDGPVGLLAVVTAAVVYRLVNYVLVVAAILATNLDRPARNALGSATDQLMMAGAVGLGGGVSVVMTVQPWLTPLLVLTVLGLHMGLLLPQFRDASRNDSKTGLFDAVFWAKLVTDELDRARRLGDTAAVLVIDLDHFKRVNDKHGHLAGDAVLRAVSEAIRHSVRGHDMVGRYGGEEFAVMLPGLGVDDALPAAERIRRAIAAVEVTTPDLDGTERVIGGLTASVGAAIFPEHGTDRTGLLLAADAALYEAKDLGRDRVRLAASGPRLSAVRIAPQH
ncbi:GGDEF domain-containing protein [Actinophytocola xanthii]|uniref:GGDEF domain-containing protein n=1 Tax=Actinophytocola xanthii TaxID=1912961 RepID=A0A1Q8CTZ0_9PSEU|nr:GGDEF domain-containing protein [Actinophytocola xanthii]OLF17813.1 GGDEF domain-containing protein [Actinophytocola xanthii]